MSASIALRPWQQRFVTALAGHELEDFLLVASPAAGKTIAAGAGVADAMRARGCDQLIVVAPTVVVRDQWAVELGRLGYRMRKRFAPHHRGWPGSVHGICATYHQVAARPGAYARACRERPTAVVLDEVHHAADSLAWGKTIRDAFEDARLRLALSGTPFRSDRDRIPFVTYRDGRCVADFEYSYTQAVRDGVCRRVSFRSHDGAATWREGDEQVTAQFSERLNAIAQARRLRAALDPAKPYMRALIAAACEDLQTVRDSGVQDAGGLAICDSQDHALQIAALIAELTGQAPIVAISDNPDAHRAIHTFARGQHPWLVAVQMVAEGVDIPRLSVIAWATAIRTELMVRQVVGRVVRTGKVADRPAIVHIPADPQLVEHASRLHKPGGHQLATRRPGPERRGGGGRRLAPVVLDTQHTGNGPRTITPDLPATVGVRASRPVRVQPPPPPLAPAAGDNVDHDVEVLDRVPTLRRAPAPAPRPALRDESRNELYRLVVTYAQLRRSIDPTYPLAAAQAELRDRMGVQSRDEATDDEIAQALAWIRGELAHLAREHPDHVQRLARARRRLRAA